MAKRPRNLSNYLLSSLANWFSRENLFAIDENMERDNILVKILGLVEGFIQKVIHLN